MQKRIVFHYTGYDARKNLVLRNDGAPYEVTLYVLLWNGDYYYLVDYNHAKQQTNHYRVDRILR